ncbi:MAG: hypothetical protein IIY01_01840 [Clostridia bacterium]|nr:hypothetical protein [Clostridia bacterium]
MSKTLDEFRTLYGIESGNPESYLAAEHRIAYNAAAQKKAQDQLLASEALAADTTAANNALARTRVTYGQNAERLAQAGLTGSGYSDNITREAYALRQNAVSDARVKYNDSMRTAADTELATQYAADSKLATGLGLLDTQRTANFEKLLAGVKDGTYTPAEASKQAELQGINDQQSAMLQTAIDMYKNQAIEELDAALSDGTITSAMVENAKAAGVIDQTKADDYNDKWRQSIQVGTDAFIQGKDENGKDVFYDDVTARRILNEYKNDPRLIDENGNNPTYEALKKIYDEKYAGKDENGKYIFKDIGAKYNFGAEGAGWKGKVGDNFSVSIGEGDSKQVFRVQSGGEVTDTEITDKAADVDEGSVFKYGNKLYIKHNGRVFLIEERPWAKKSYRALEEAFNKK